MPVPGFAAHTRMARVRLKARVISPERCMGGSGRHALAAAKQSAGKSYFFFVRRYAIVPMSPRAGQAAESTKQERI
jgi:hypothetical protein